MDVAELEDTQFNYRVGGVAIDGNRVLLHRRGQDDFWTLPSWKTVMLEPATLQLEKRLATECGTEPTVGRLMFVVESLFEYQGRQRHELSLCFLVRFAEGTPILHEQRPFQPLGGNRAHTFLWQPLDQIDRIDMRPSALRQLLRRLPDRAVYVVHDELGTN